MLLTSVQLADLALHPANNSNRSIFGAEWSISEVMKWHCFSVLPMALLFQLSSAFAQTDTCDLSLNFSTGTSTQKIELEVSQDAHIAVIKDLAKRSKRFSMLLTPDEAVKKLSETQAMVIAENTCIHFEREVMEKYERDFAPDSFKCKATALQVEEGKWEQGQLKGYSKFTALGSFRINKFIAGTYLPQSKASYVLIAKPLSDEEKAKAQIDKIHTCLAATSQAETIKIKKLLELARKYKSGKMPTAKEIADSGFGKPESNEVVRPSVNSESKSQNGSR